jgi:hypothetical protein
MPAGLSTGLRAVFQLPEKRVSNKSLSLQLRFALNFVDSYTGLAFSFEHRVSIRLYFSFYILWTSYFRQSVAPLARRCTCRPDDPRPLQHPSEKPIIRSYEPIERDSENDGRESERLCCRHGFLYAPQCARLRGSSATIRRPGLAIGDWSQSSWRNHGRRTRQGVEYV